MTGQMFELDGEALVILPESKDDRITSITFREPNAEAIVEISINEPTNDSSETDQQPS